MKVKCKICGRKGFYEYGKISEFHATNFLFLWRTKKHNFICRSCAGEVLDMVAMEQRQIKKLYEPKIKSKEETA